MLRFLWFDDVTKPFPKIQRYQFGRLVFGLTPSPAVLASIIEHHLNTYKEYERKMVSLFKDSFYVDDFAGGAKNDDDAVEVYERAKVMMKDEVSLSENGRLTQRNFPKWSRRVSKRKDTNTKMATLR